MRPNHLLRLEGLAIAAAALAAFVVLDGPWWLLVVLFLAPDLSMLGYLVGPRLGSRAYNLVHTYTLPLGVGALGAWADGTLVLQAVAIWIAHIGVDRLAGYGLKYETGFKDTHLGRQPALVQSLEPTE